VKLSKCLTKKLVFWNTSVLSPFLPRPKIRKRWPYDICAGKQELCEQKKTWNYLKVLSEKQSVPSYPLNKNLKLTFTKLTLIKISLFLNCQITNIVVHVNIFWGELFSQFESFDFIFKILGSLLYILRKELIKK